MTLGNKRQGKKKGGGGWFSAYAVEERERYVGDG